MDISLDAPKVVIKFANWIATGKDLLQIKEVWTRSYTRSITLAYNRLGLAQDKLMPYGLIKPGMLMIGAAKLVNGERLWTIGHATSDHEFPMLPTLCILGHGISWEVDGLWIRKGLSSLVDSRYITGWDKSKLSALNDSWNAKIMCQEVMPMDLAETAIQATLDDLPHSVARQILT